MFQSNICVANHNLTDLPCSKSFIRVLLKHYLHLANGMLCLHVIQFVTELQKLSE